jgi:hypothetical protein
VRARFAEAGVWAGCLGALYLALLSTVSMSELAVAAGAGAAVGWLAPLGRIAEAEQYGVRREWLGWFAELPATLAADIWRLASAVWTGRGHRSVGVEETLDLAGIRPQAVAETRRALAAMAVGLTPASYVVTPADDEPDRLIVHRMRRGASAYERRVAS